MLFSSPVKRARLLAVLLLAAIAWGSTVEFTHHHGSKASSVESLSSTAQWTQTPIADEALSTEISSSNTNGTSSKSNTGAECLICQLHQNLSASEISHTPGVGPTETRGLNSPPSVVVQLSEFRSTGHGRAPPSFL
ncbi:MAG TPA: hypothetical protein VK582_21705 [Pyrinomonadaceae bacterium]|nr:hypothetical protein [Pyrinomonadaceae bacterium]